MKRVKIVQFMCVIACLSTFASGCVRTHILGTGLSADEMKVSQATFLRNASFEWVVIVPEAEVSTPPAFVRVMSNEKEAIFQVVEIIDGRAHKVVPMHAVEMSWLYDAAGATDTRVELLDEDAFFAMEQGSIKGNAPGYMTIKGGAVTGVTWTGQAPAQGSVFSVWSMDPALPISQRIQSSGVYEDVTTVSVEHKLDDGRYMLVIDGIRDDALAQNPYKVGVVQLGSTSKPSVVDGVEFTPVKLDPALLKKSTHELRLAALELGVDAITWKDKDRSSMTLLAVDRYDEQISGGVGLVPGIVEVPLEFKSQQDLLKGIKALDSVRHGHALKAYTVLEDVPFRVEGSEKVAQLRRAELLGTAGFAQLVYLEEKEKYGKALPAPVFTYLSRSFVFSGATHEAIAMAVGARDAFFQGGRYLGVARNVELIGISHGLEHNTAKSVWAFQNASKLYRGSGVNDAIAAARAEELMSVFAARNADVQTALSEGKRSRSRYYYANDLFSCAQMELELAAYYLLEGGDEMVKDAAESVRYGGMRMQEIGHKVGINRARAMTALVSHKLKPGSVKLTDVIEVYRTSLLQRDGWGEAVSASALILLGGQLKPNELAQVGASLERYSAVFDASLLGATVEQAYASACAQGYDDRGGQCQVMMAKYRPDDSLVRRWVEQGYGHLLGDSSEGVESSQDRLVRLLEERQESTSKNDFVLSAYIELYLAAVANSRGESDAQQAHISKMFDYINRVDANERATVLVEFAQELAVRGQEPLMLPLYEEAFKVAHAQGQRQAAMQAALEQAVLLRQSGQLVEALAAVEQATSRVAKDAPKDLARVAFDRALIHSMRGSSSAAKVDWSIAYERVKKLEAVDALDVLLYAFQVSLNEANQVQSRELQEAISRVEAGMPSSLVATLEGKRILAQSELLRAQAQEKKGNLAQVVTLASSVDKTLADDPSASAAESRAKALLLLLRYAQSSSQSEDIEQRLEELWARQLERLEQRLFSVDEFSAPITVAQALSEVRYLRGDAKGAGAVLLSLLLSGLSPSQKMATVSCQEGLLFVASGEFTQGKVELERCVKLKSEHKDVYRARVLLALSQKTQAERKRGIEMLIQSPVVREQRRRQMLLGFVVPAEAQDKAFVRLQKSYDKTVDGEAKAQAGVAVIEKQIELHDLVGASESLELLKPLLYELGQEYPADYVRLKTELMLQQLDVVQARYYLDRASVELPQNMEPVRQVKMDWLRARIALGFGQWTMARAYLSDARDLASESGLSEWTARINTLAEQFQLTL